ncbi:hypothetical protein Q7P36_010390 [Cladosporium allicinum]
MNSGLPSSVCGSASDSTYTSADQSSIHSTGGRSSIASSSTPKPKRTVRFQDPVPAPAEALSNLSLSSLDSSSDEGSYNPRRPRFSHSSSSSSSSIAGGKLPTRSSSPRFSRPLSMGRPSLRRDVSVSSTASAPGELEFTDWLARMEESRSRSSSQAPSAKDRKALPRGSSTDAAKSDATDMKKKRRSWVNLLVR